MRYKPLLLALLLCFAAPSFAANETPKNKTAAVKKANAKEKSTNKAADKPKADVKKSVKEKDADKKKTAAETKKAAKNSGAVKKEDAPKAAAKNQKDHADERNAADKADKKERGKKNPVKADEAKAKNKADSKEAAKKEPVKAKDKVSAKENAKKDSAKQESAKAKDKAERKEAAKKDSAKAKDKTAHKAAARGDSDELRAAVSAASNDLEEKQALQKRTANFLIHVNATLKELQQTRNSLSNINRQQRDAWSRLQKLNTDLTRLKTEIGNTRAQISRFVSGNYKNAQPNAVALFLKNAEPGQKTRFLRYTRYINTANEKVVQNLAKQQKELNAQESRVNSELGRLKKLQANAQAALKRQGVNNTPEQAESRRQNAAMAKDAQKAVNHKDNERRLNNLISDLDKQKAEARKKEAEARKKAAEARLAAERKRRADEKKTAAERAALSNLTAEDMKLQAPTAAAFVPITSPNSFSRMQGRLKKPVGSGLLSGLFGHVRDNGEVWKGVFYSTPPASVNSIATGSVVYAAELEGYGNVVVIDHGDNYVSVYSGLSEIDVAKGYNVGAGHKIGTSGALPDGEEGLYLEIRYNGQNMNPLSWIN